MPDIPTGDWSWINADAERFERAWKKGLRLRIEDYLAAVEEPRRGRLLEELLKVEIELRRRDGERPDLEEYRQRFPAHITAVAAVFCDGHAPHPSAAGAGSSGPAASGTVTFNRSLIRGVLAGLAETGGSGPRVLLRDTEPEPDSPVVRPSSPEMPEETGRYQLLGEIGHGGMGAVLKGRDPDLGRDLAVKILLDEHRHAPDLVRRFIEEAQIGGQLQHPGIVPVYELGQFGDRRPYFTMKLVKGRTLAAFLKERASTAHDLPRFLGIFEHVCQTVAYAHARGVIHRDLKPSNIMVGAFGEVQVMDWGLAKVLPQGGTADEPPPDSDEPAVSVVRTIRSGSDADASRPGSVLGTPAYMAPEQAGGDVEAIDERADVFGLGSILCEILTGRPAYTGSSFEAVLRKAMRGETSDALRRLDGCGADGELRSLAGDCLAAEAEERPRDAGEVARRMTAYLSGVQERLRAAELGRAAEEARADEAQATAAAAERARAAEEARAEQAQAAAIAAEGRARAERRARRMSVGLAASILIAGALGAAGWTWVERDRVARVTARTTLVSTAVQEATGSQGQAQAAAVGDLVAWTKALAAAQKARELVEPGLDLALRRHVEGLLATITSETEAAEESARAAQSNRLLLGKLVDIRSAKTDDPDGSISDADYATAFREAEIDVTALPPSEVGVRIKAQAATVAAALVAALDDWAAMRRYRRLDQPGALRLSEAANAADPDSWRVGLRMALDLSDRGSRTKALRDLAASTNRETSPAVDLDLLGTALYAMGEPKSAEEVLRAGRRRFPDEVWLNYDLARLLEAQSRGDEALRYYSIARALRPDTAHDLAHLLELKGESVEAIAVFRDLVRLRPDDGRHWGCYGRLLKEKGDRSGSRAALTKAVANLRRMAQLKPDDATVHLLLGIALYDMGNPEDAITALRTAVRLKPGLEEAHHRIGLVLHEQGKLAEAIVELREAIHLKADSAYTHNSLGIALKDQGKLPEAIAAGREAIRLRPDFAYSHNSLGIALQISGKLDDAIAEYREAIRLKPDYANPHINLVILLLGQGKIEQAYTESREAVRLEPNYGLAHNALGVVLRKQGKLEEAIAEFRDAVRLQPDSAEVHHNLGAFLCDVKHNYKAAEEEFRSAIRLKRDSAIDHNALGMALKAQGKLAAAITEFREATRLKPDLSVAHLMLGQALGGAGVLGEAMNAYRAAIRSNPSDTTAHLELGAILGNLGEYPEALAEFRVVLGTENNNATAHYNIGTMLHHQKKWNEAIAAYREALRFNPNLAEARSNLGRISLDQGRWDESMAEFKRAIAIKPDLAEAHQGLGEVLQARGKPTEAIVEFREVARLRPDLVEAHFKLGNTLHDQGKLAEAIAEYKTAIRIKPHYAEAHNNLGIALRDQGKPAEAIAEYKTAIRIRPNDALAHSNLGNALRDQRKLNEAIAEYREAIRIQPDLAMAHGSLGDALRVQGKLEESIVEFRAAIRIKPELAVAHGNLAIVLGLQGKPEDAIAEYREAIRLKPDLAMAHNNLAWALVLSPERPRRDYDEGLVHARKAVELAKQSENFYGTLALAEYRSGHWPESLASSERAMALRKGMYAYDWFFQAMARVQKGEKDEARKWFDKAVTWTKEKDPKNIELRQFWAEAAQLLGQPGPATAGPRSPATPADDKPH